MAFYDWNKDGKKNNIDNYIEYEIYKKQEKRNMVSVAEWRFLWKQEYTILH